MTNGDERCLEGKRVPRTPECDPDCVAMPLSELIVAKRIQVRRREGAER